MIDEAIVLLEQYGGGSFVIFMMGFAAAVMLMVAFKIIKDHNKGD